MTHQVIETTSFTLVRYFRYKPEFFKFICFDLLFLDIVLGVSQSSRHPSFSHLILSLVFYSLTAIHSPDKRLQETIVSIEVFFDIHFNWTDIPITNQTKKLLMNFISDSTPVT